MTKEELRKRTCCFTGHRRISCEDLPNIKYRIRIAILSAINEGYTYFGCGGALGFDILAAQTVLELKREYAHIRLILVLPCLSQTRYWRNNDVSEYERIKKNADKVVYISREYTKDCMYKRNRHLVDNSSLCICYCIRQSGGTAYTVSYAKSHALRIVNISV